MGSIPIHDRNCNEKMGIKATGCGVHIVTAVENKKKNLFAVAVAM